MEFIDNVTPSLPSSYKDTLQGITNKRTWTKATQQMANDWASMYYQNAYNTALLNYQNEYNSPLQQMLRYQEAGINPFIAANDAGNMGSSFGGSAPRGSTPGTDSPAAMASVAMQGINSVNNTLQSAKQIYDYVQYGRPLAELNLQGQGYANSIAFSKSIAAAEEAEIKAAEAAWNKYWNFGPAYAQEVVGSPRAMYMEESTQRISAQIEQLKSLVDVLYPSQKQANEARAALSDYQKQVLQGQNDAILSIDTGDSQRDAILKQVLFWLGNKLHY